MSNAHAMPMPDADDFEDAAETTPGGNEPIKWVEVMTTPGIMAATVVVGRLRAEGIPARAWQESAGGALGLTVGILGTGHVEVPEDYVEQANEVLHEQDV